MIEAARMGAGALPVTVMVGAASRQIPSLGVEAPACAAAAVPWISCWPILNAAAAAPAPYVYALNPMTGAAR